MILNVGIADRTHKPEMSPRNFARLFQQEVGRTPARYIEDLRLEAARRQIESAAMSLQEVAGPVALLQLRYFAAHSSSAWALRPANIGPLLGVPAVGNRLAADWQEWLAFCP